MIKILNEMGEEFKEGYEMIMNMAEAVGPLRKITVYINGETDLRREKDDGMKTREETLRRLLNPDINSPVIGIPKADSSLAGDSFAVDTMCLELRSVYFSYSSKHPTKAAFQLKVPFLELPQGSTAL